MYPRLLIDPGKIRENAAEVVRRAGELGIGVFGVTKGFCADPAVVGQGHLPASVQHALLHGASSLGVRQDPRRTEGDVGAGEAEQPSTRAQASAATPARRANVVGFMPADAFGENDSGRVEGNRWRPTRRLPSLNACDAPGGDNDRGFAVGRS